MLTQYRYSTQLATETINTVSVSKLNRDKGHLLDQGVVR